MLYLGDLDFLVLFNLFSDRENKDAQHGHLLHFPWIPHIGHRGPSRKAFLTGLEQNTSREAQGDIGHLCSLGYLSALCQCCQQKQRNL